MSEPTPIDKIVLIAASQCRALARGRRTGGVYRMFPQGRGVSLTRAAVDGAVKRGFMRWVTPKCAAAIMTDKGREAIAQQ